MKNSGRVSIIIPCYKQAHYLRQAVDCALGQSHPDVEVIVVDDGSPDDTAQVAAEYGDLIRYVRKPNAGLPAARNTGILASTGEWLIYLDADDLLPHDLVERHLETARENPGAGVVYATYHYVDSEGLPFGPRFDPQVPEDAFHTYLTGNLFPPHAGMTHRAALANAGLFDVHLNSYEDWDMWIRLACTGAGFARTTSPGVPYRQHPTSMSQNFDRMRRAGLKVLRKSATYHPRCAACRRGLANGYWGLRSAFVQHAGACLADQKRDGQYLKALKSVAGAFVQDPLLGGVSVRNAARRLKWGLLNNSAGSRSG